MGGSGAAKINTPDGVMDSLRDRFQALNTNQRMFMGLGFAGLVLALGVVFSAGRSSQDYRVLFANVNEGDGAAIITALQQMNVPYQFTEGGGAITVPQALVYETRLKLAGQGLLAAGAQAGAPPLGQVNLQTQVGLHLLGCTVPVGGAEGERHAQVNLTRWARA